MKIVMMGNRGNAAFGNRFCQGQPQGYMHGDGQGILNNQQVDLVAVEKLMQAHFEQGPQRMNRLGQHGGTATLPKSLLVDTIVEFVLEMGFRNEVGALRRLVGFTGEPEDIMPAAAQDLGPFAGFQRDSVSTRKTGGYKAYFLTHMLLARLEVSRIPLNSSVRSIETAEPPKLLSPQQPLKHQSISDWQDYATGFCADRGFPDPGGRNGEKHGKEGIHSKRACRLPHQLQQHIGISQQINAICSVFMFNYGWAARIAAADRSSKKLPTTAHSSPKGR